MFALFLMNIKVKLFANHCFLFYVFKADVNDVKAE